MTIEQKAKAYDKAIEKAREWYDDSQIGIGFKANLEKLFPELKESEDEKIRREMIFFLENSDGQTIPINQYNSWIAWLEKQADQPQGKSALEAIKEKKVDNQNCSSADKVEPKFKVGNWVTNGVDCTFQITSIENGIYYYYYHANECGRDIESTDNSYHLWSIQDATNGDVLADWNNIVFIFKAIEDDAMRFVCAYNEKWDGLRISDRSTYVGLAEPQINFHPATKEQRDLLFQKMKEAGYEWDAEKKQLKKIEQKPVDKEIKGNVGGISSNSEWSEEDEKNLCDIINRICTIQTAVVGSELERCYELEDWLKSLKDRVQPKQEWSEEDEKILKDIITDVRYNGYNNDMQANSYKKINWLKSLRLQNRWKPTKKQLIELRNVISGCSFETPVLVELEEQLKKLL